MGQQSFCRGGSAEVRLRYQKSVVWKAAEADAFPLEGNAICPTPFSFSLLSISSFVFAK
jgi:hypothetical protein